MNPILNKYDGSDITCLTTFFMWNGMKLECRLSGVRGRASAHSYDVEIINIARGELHLTKQGWSFSTRKGHFDRVADQLGKKIEEYWEKVDELNNPLSRA